MNAAFLLMTTLSAAGADPVPASIPAPTPAPAAAAMIGGPGYGGCATGPACSGAYDACKGDGARPNLLAKLKAKFAPAPCDGCGALSGASDPCPKPGLLSRIKAKFGGGGCDGPAGSSCMSGGCASPAGCALPPAATTPVGPVVTPNVMPMTPVPVTPIEGGKKPTGAGTTAQRTAPPVVTTVSGAKPAGVTLSGAGSGF